MSRIRTKVERLIRLNAFREERADNALRLARNEQAMAVEQHTAATAIIDRLGEWKSRSEPGARLDLTAYGAALVLEQAAMERAEALAIAVSEREHATRQATDALTDAAHATRASDHRGKREQHIVQLGQEKRDFDQATDVWLNNREVTRD